MARALAAVDPYTPDDARLRRDAVNTEYLLWFAALVVVIAATLLWLVVGDVPEIPGDPALDPGLDHAEGRPGES
ncbi:MAG: hypothetical protein P4L30_07855 [Candidatus Limnocylindrales bacterium]|nr:hypothetical protein [Candidatus Limnocylindrales bacterium]